MKKSSNTKLRTSKRPLCLGDVVAAVSASSKNTRETVAAVVDLLESGRVRIQALGRPIRAHVC